MSLQFNFHFYTTQLEHAKNKAINSFPDAPQFFANKKTKLPIISMKDGNSTRVSVIISMEK